MATSYKSFKKKEQAKKAQMQVDVLRNEAPIEDTRDTPGAVKSPVHTPASDIVPMSESSSGAEEPELGFKMAGRRFGLSRTALGLKFASNKKTKKLYGHDIKRGSHKAEGNRTRADDVLDKVMEWSAGHYPLPKNPTSYQDLWNKARRVVGQDRAKAVGPIQLTTSTIPQHSDEEVNLEAALNKSGDTKIADQAAYNEYASDVGEEITADPRERATDVKRYYHRDDPTQTYTVTGSGHFLLGGSAVTPKDHTYEKMLADMKADKGLDDKGLANFLLEVLQGGEAKGDDNAKVRKFAMIASTSELYRAGINPVALQAALYDIATNGGDIHKRLNEQVLYMASQGGSKRSQFHREGKPVNDEEFNEIARAQHDVISWHASSLGYDPSNAEQIQLYVERATKAALNGRSKFVKEGWPEEETQEKLQEGPKELPPILPDPEDSIAPVLAPDVAPVVQPSSGNPLQRASVSKTSVRSHPYANPRASKHMPRKRGGLPKPKLKSKRSRDELTTSAGYRPQERPLLTRRTDGPTLASLSNEIGMDLEDGMDLEEKQEERDESL